jgi:formate-dependent nitrite reductase cytochrome c552 subunit
MWRAGSNRGKSSVVCIACGTSVSQGDAREYDKEGDRWERDGKEFEYLCKNCHSDLSHQPRAGLESLLVDVEEGSMDRREFLEQYVTTVQERSGTTDGSES